MCYYNGMRVTRAQLIRLLNMEKELKEMSRPVQSGFDYQDWPIIKPNYNSTDFEIKMVHWEYIPAFVKDSDQLQEMRKMYSWLNAKSENLFVNEKGKLSIYREGALNGRCLVLSSGFFEWRHIPMIGKKGQPLKATQKIPYYISLKNQDVFYIAGIMREWTNVVKQKSADTFAIVTTEATEFMASIHNSKKRMPTILTEELANEWISKDLSENDIKRIAGYKHDHADVVAWPVAKDFKTSVDPTKEFEYKNLPPLDVRHI